jgi:RING finger protein 121
MDPEISDKVKLELKHKALHEEHAGHEDMHAKMVLVMFGTLFAAQILLFIWQKKSKKTYNVATLVGMCIIPMGYSIYFQFYRFVFLGMRLFLQPFFVIKSQ